MVRRVALAGLAASLVALAPAADRAFAAAPAPAPPDLQRLEQATLGLHIETERFALTLSVEGDVEPSGLLGSFSRAHARKAASEPLLQVSGETSFASMESNVTLEFLGINFHERTLGGLTYVERPGLSKLARGRRWVVEPTPKKVATALGAPITGGLRDFSKLYRALAHASTIDELGPRTVDGQATTDFHATIPLGAFASNAASRRKFAKEFGRSVSLDVAFAEDGLPVRIAYTLHLHEKKRVHHAAVVVEEDTLAINQPIVPVLAPAAAETITKAELERLEAAEFKKFLKSLKRHKRRKGG